MPVRRTGEPRTFTERRREVHGDAAGAQQRRGLARSGALQQRRGAHRDLARARRADDEVLELDREVVEVLHVLLGLDQQQRGQSRRLGIVAQIAAHRDAAFVGEVDDDYVGMGVLDRLQRVAAAARFEDVESVRRQALAELARELADRARPVPLPSGCDSVHGVRRYLSVAPPPVPTRQNEDGPRA